MKHLDVWHQLTLLLETFLRHLLSHPFTNPFLFGGCSSGLHRHCRKRCVLKNQSSLVVTCLVIFSSFFCKTPRFRDIGKGGDLFVGSLHRIFFVKKRGLDVPDVSAVIHFQARCVFFVKYQGYSWRSRESRVSEMYECIAKSCLIWICQFDFK